MNDRPRPRTVWPSWLDGQTVAIIAVVAAVGAMTQNGFTSIRTEMGLLRTELLGEIDQVRGELRAEIGDLRTDVRRLDDRLRTVEVAVASIEAGMESSMSASRAWRDGSKPAERRK